MPFIRKWFNKDYTSSTSWILLVTMKNAHTARILSTEIRIQSYSNAGTFFAINVYN